MNELKPCPFCRGEAFLSSIWHEERASYPWYAHVICSKCQASCGSTGFSESEEEAKEKAVRAWNRRAQEGAEHE